MIRKSSKQRDMILNYMKQIDGHVTPEQVFQEMNAGGQKISLATIYRNLNILCEMHKTCKPHYHLHCIKCDRILDLDIPYLESFNEEMSKQTGLPIKTHNMMAEGICQDCLKKQNGMDQEH